MSGQQHKPTLIILAGGKGTRLRALDATRPKPMVLVGGKPFLHWLISHYVALGYIDFVLSTCYMAEMIENYPWTSEFPGKRFRFVRESQPLGTGGAVIEIFSQLDLREAWVINGDTLLPQRLPDVDPAFEALYSALRETELFDATPNLHVDQLCVTAEGPNGRYFDAGAAYVTKKALDRYQGAVPCSLHQVLAPSMEQRKVAYAVLPGACYDIGTPERFKRFEEYLGALLSARG